MKIRLSGYFWLFPARITNQLMIFGEPAGPKEVIGYCWLFWILEKAPKELQKSTKEIL